MRDMHVMGMAESQRMLTHGEADEFLKSSGGFAVALGIVLAILSAVANGSFTIFSKFDSVKKSGVDHLVFNFWACIGIVLSSLPFLVKSRLVYTPLGLISGLLFVLSAANSFRSVRLIGVSVGTGIWSGTAVLVSFAAGILLDPEDHTRSLLWAGIGILVIIVGVVGVAYSGHVGRKATGQEEDLSTLLNSQDKGQKVQAELKAARGKDEGMQPEDEGRLGTFTAGLLAALFAGLLGGLIMIPLTWADDSVQGVNYLPSFAVGVLVFAPLVTFLPYVTTTCQWPNFAPAATALPGIFSGIVWNIANVLSILAIGYISYSVAYPIMQTGIFIAGIWGMFQFNEIAGTYACTTYWISGVVMVVGIGILTWAHG